MTIESSSWSALRPRSVLLRTIGCRRPAAAGVLAILLLAGTVHGQETIDLRSLELPRWSLEEDLRLGSVDGEHDAFVRPVRIRERGGQLYVLDAGLPGLRAFDRTGAYLHQIGRQGAGPGEYTAPANFGFMGDTIWVVDGATRRVALFGEDGKVLADFALEPEIPGTQPPQPMQVLGPDDFLVIVPPGPETSLYRHKVGPVLFQQSIVRRNRSGTRADTLATYTVESGLLVVQADDAGFSVIPYRPIRQHPFVSYDPDREEIGVVERSPATSPDRGEFHVTIRRRDGPVLAYRRFVYRPVPVPASVKDSIRAALSSRLRRSRAPGAEQRVEAGLAHLALPDFLPPVSSGMAVGKNGTRWIARESLDRRIPTDHLVTDAALNPLAILEFPRSALRVAGPIDGDHVWLVEKDEVDVEYLVRYRIRREIARR